MAGYLPAPFYCNLRILSSGCLPRPSRYTTCMPIRCIPAVIALLLAFSACVSVTAEEVEKLGPQLIAEGAFLSGDGDEPQKPAGWLITTDEDGTALWLEEGHRDRGSAKLEGPRIESTVSLSQQRWLGTASQCYLLSFYYRGNNVTVEARLTVKGDGGRSLASVTRSRPVQSGWNEFRMFFEPWPLGLNGELETVLAMHGRGHVQLDGVSLTAYEGPYTRRDRSFGSDMPVSPPTSGKAESPVLFTWPAFAGREIYTLEVEFPDGMIYIADVHNNCSLVELPVGEYSWTVNAVLGDDEFIEIVPFTPLTVTAVRGKLPQKPVRPATPLPGDDSDYARWRKLGGISRIDDSFLPLAGREWIPGMPIPGQASPGRELDINTIALNWDAASDTLANASAVKRLGGKNCDPVAREITQNMQEEAQNTRSEERRVGKECRSRGWP